ncbi:MAG: hypothetical protein GC159_17685 [Phycisphaera sp.]|nr:hypothetical protein [Phycisphaera sp.]
MVRRTRSRPTDPVVLKDHWQQAYRFLAADAVTTMNQYAASADLFNPAKRHTAVTVQITSVIQKSDGTYQLRWKQTAYQHGAQADVSWWTGLFTVKIVPPKSSRAIYHNPLGVYVTHFNWTEDPIFEILEAEGRAGR